MTGLAIRLKSWPFSAGEVVTLIWLGSPQMTGAQNQWQVVAFFEARSGEARGITLAWAMLPLLRLGQRYRDGVPIPDDFAAPVQGIDLSTATPPQLRTARSVLSPSVYRLYVAENWQELCWVWALADQSTVVVPMLVLLQGLFSGGSALTRGLLDQHYLDQITHETESRTLSLTFDAKFELPIRRAEREAFMMLLARIVSDPSFTLAFRSVALNRAADPLGPLVCELPELGARWMVRLFSRGRVHLVQQLLRAEPLSDLHLEKVAYFHPLYPRREVALPRPKTARAVRTPRSLLIESRAPASRSPRVCSEVPSSSAALLETKRLTVENVGTPEAAEAGAAVYARKGGNEREVSFAETGQNASAPQANVRPGRADDAQLPPEDLNWSVVEEWAAPQEDGLNSFRQKLMELQALHTDVEVEFRLGPEEATGGARRLKRPYAVVALATPDHPILWLIEFAQRPARPLSTLALRGEQETWQELQPLLHQVLEKGLDQRYWWNVTQLRAVAADAAATIQRLKHAKEDERQWANRVYSAYFA
ncbi:hypothetical protein [Deinococcus yunweiensis]|uniref:hypothetical protein n=1 Tax=Deinococcus yunweiensis TaxID=367282 RepID=UPI00398EDF81